MERATWEALVVMEKAIWSSKTWSEFREKLPDGEFERVPIWFTSGGVMIYQEGEEILFLPAENEKTGYEHVTPITDEARKALE